MHEMGIELTTHPELCGGLDLVAEGVLGEALVDACVLGLHVADDDGGLVPPLVVHGAQGADAGLRGMDG